MSKVSTDNAKNYISSFLAFSSCDIRLSERVELPISEFTTGALTPVDKESYRPDSVTIRNQLLSPSGSPRVGVFDFQDGIDTGIRPVRRPDLDRVQVDAILKEKLADAEARARDAEASEIEKALAKTEAEKAKKARIDEAIETSKAVAKASNDS